MRLSIKRTAYGSMVTAGCCLRNVIDARQCVLKSATISVRHSDIYRLYLEMQVRMEANKSKQYRDPTTKSLNYLSHKNHCLIRDKLIWFRGYLHFFTLWGILSRLIKATRDTIESSIQGTIGKVIDLRRVSQKIVLNQLKSLSLPKISLSQIWVSSMCWKNNCWISW